MSLLAMIVLGMVAATILFKMAKNYRPGRSKIQDDLKQLRAELAPMVAGLVPWTSSEMEQLSFNQINRTSKGGVVKTSKGVLTTVYHEPVIAWAHKKYVGQQENGLIYARTSDREFVYRLKNGEVEMVVGDELVGVLNPSGILVGHKSNQQLAQINKDETNLVLPVKVNNKLVGGLSNPERNQKSNARVFQHLAKLNKSEEELVLSLSILEMVKREVGR